MIVDISREKNVLFLRGFYYGAKIHQLWAWILCPPVARLSLSSRNTPNCVHLIWDLHPGAVDKIYWKRLCSRKSHKLHQRQGLWLLRGKLPVKFLSVPFRVLTYTGYLHWVNDAPQHLATSCEYFIILHLWTSVHFSSMASSPRKAWHWLTKVG